jgi:hypothetical protein
MHESESSRICRFRPEDFLETVSADVERPGSNEFDLGEVNGSRETPRVVMLDPPPLG